MTGSPVRGSPWRQWSSWLRGLMPTPTEADGMARGLAQRTSWASAFVSGPSGDLVWPGCPAHPPVCASFPGDASFQGWAGPAHVAGEGLCGVLVPAPCCAGRSGVLGLKKQ